jgi:hypothetical protein
MADGAQKNGVEFLELFDRTVGQDLAGALVALTSGAASKRLGTSLDGHLLQMVIAPRLAIRHHDGWPSDNHSRGKDFMIRQFLGSAVLAGAMMLVVGCSGSSSTNIACDGGTCGDPNWAKWPMPNSAADVTAGGAES